MLVWKSLFKDEILTLWRSIQSYTDEPNTHTHTHSLSHTHTHFCYERSTNTPVYCPMWRERTSKHKALHSTLYDKLLSEREGST